MKRVCTRKVLKKLNPPPKEKEKVSEFETRICAFTEVSTIKFIKKEPPPGTRPRYFPLPSPSEMIKYSFLTSAIKFSIIRFLPHKFISELDLRG